MIVILISEQLQTPGMESKVRVVVAVTTLLLGPLDVGSSIIGKEGVLEMILVMANSGDFLMQVKKKILIIFVLLLLNWLGKSSIPLINDALID